MVIQPKFRRYAVIVAAALVVSLVVTMWVGQEAATPNCTTKYLWYTKGSEVCAPTKVQGVYKWQNSLTKSDTTKFMNTCRSFFSASAGQLLCDWMQKYVNNVLTVNGPRDNCLNYWKGLLNNAALVAQTSKTATVGTAITPYVTKNSWVCHP
jgi:hypothetical protein